MQKPETLEDLKKRGQQLASTDQPLAAWNGQQSTKDERFHVIFDGRIYFNTEWVDSGQCPGDVNDNGVNPWQFERDATKQELARLGNPTSRIALREHAHALKH
ncbi:hypothetical protein [Hyalangium minutum]|uniref:Chitinase n=1 Tax=Hyalangium minutum TaxID=394096 RepID=A0A085W530_9BACT|nr:hypothetical protein [Hyalangium minutum]KFE62793.1 Chitinase [Hyalangium minutum]